MPIVISNPVNKPFLSNNWGNSKGETYNDVCVVLNEKTYNLYTNNKLTNLPPTTKNKLYVACSRPTNNLYIIQEKIWTRACIHYFIS